MNEIALTLSLSCFKGSVMGGPEGMSTTNQLSTMNGNYIHRDTVLVPANLSGSISGATFNSSPIIITTAAAHNLVTNDSVTIAGVLGDTAANGTWPITVLSPTTFSIPPVGNATYNGGGTYSTANGIQLPMGQVTQPARSVFANLDPNNYVQLRNGQAGAIVCRIPPAETHEVPLDPACVLWALANTASIYLDYFVTSL